MRRSGWAAAWLIVFGAIFLPLIMALGIGVVILVWRAVAG